MAVTPNVGLLGGSFDPVHQAHIALADAARAALRLDSVQLIPAANPWQRAPLKAGADHRLAMLELAATDRPWLNVNPVELHRGGKTYTLDTLKGLPQGPCYFWLMGADQLLNFHTWRGWQEIARLVCLGVAARPGSAHTVPAELNKHLDAIGRDITWIPFEPRAVSATEIRRQLVSGDSIIPGLDPAVLTYIRRHRLYENDDRPELTV